MAKVSVIIPAYEPGELLRPAIESVYAQTFDDWELLVIDDGSREDLSWVQRDFPNLRFIRQKHSGVSVGRNNGFLQASGEYIAFLDQDDVWMPDKLAKQVAVMDKHPQLAACYTGLVMINKDGTLHAREPQSALVEPEGECECTIALNEDGEVDGKSRLYRSIVYFKSGLNAVPSTMMMRRACLAFTGLMDPMLPFTGDYDLLIRLGAHFPIGHIPNRLVRYRVHEKSFSKQYEVCRVEVSELIHRYQLIAKLTADKMLARDARQMFTLSKSTYSAHAYDRSRSSLKEGNIKAMAYHLLQAVRFDPLFVSRSLWQYITTRASSQA